MKKMVNPIHVAVGVAFGHECGCWEHQVSCSKPWVMRGPK